MEAIEDMGFEVKNKGILQIDIQVFNGMFCFNSL